MRRFPRRFRRRGIVVVACLAVALLTAVAKGLRRSGWRGPAPSRGTVRRVVDGDTFDLTNGARIRLLDIDAPEFAGSTERGPAQEATDALTEFLAGASSGHAAGRTAGRAAHATSGRVVTLRYGPRVRDRYNRFLAYVFVEGAEGGKAGPLFVNVELVRRGLARAYTGGGHGPRYDDILAAEREAREAGRGVWGVKRAF